MIRTFSKQASDDDDDDGCYNFTWSLVEMRLYWEFPWVQWVPWGSHGNGNR